MSTWIVVEDEPDIYEVLLAMFEVWGIDGVAFVDGGEAVAWIDDVDEGRMPDNDLPELAIVDVRLPEIPGQQVSARLRRSPVFKNMAIVLVTAYILHPQEEEDILAESGADLIMYKPLPGPAEFRAMLEEVLERRAALADAESEAEDQPTEAQSAPVDDTASGGEPEVNEPVEMDASDETPVDIDESLDDRATKLVEAGEEPIATEKVALDRENGWLDVDLAVRLASLLEQETEEATPAQPEFPEIADTPEPSDSIEITGDSDVSDSDAGLTSNGTARARVDSDTEEQ